MRTERTITTYEGLEQLLEEVGPLVSVPFAAVGLGVSDTRVRALCETGRLRAFAVLGTYYVTASDVEVRRKARLRSAKGLDAGQLSERSEKAYLMAVG